uniref:Uncharacterized protein LOC111114544 n=1 Tax=Crassostrea virginica TaxID=6565 RepID=A0A8B8BYY2_CRAVI|nr:uncharacterized protein LOC111114544 [Crassostrea virginica]
MSDVPGSSSAPSFSLTKAAENYCRLCQLIVTVCSDLLRLILSRYIDPANLRQELDKNKGKLQNIIKNNEQRQLLYPAPAGSSVKAQDLDLTLLYTILRNVCNIPQPQCKWGKTPQNGDVSLVACIERIRIQRNLISGHRSIGEIEHPEFLNIWQELKDNIGEIEEQLFGGNMYRRRVDELFSCDLSKSEAQEYVEEFQCLRDSLDDVQSQASRYFGKKKAHLDKIEERQASLTMEIQGFNARKRARLDELEQHQTSVATNFIDELRETERHILQVLQGRHTGIENHTTDKLRETEERILNQLQARMDGFEQQQTAMTTNLTDGLSKLEKRLEDKFAVMIEHKKDTKSRCFPLVLMSTIEVPGMYDICHISVVTPDRLWVSDRRKLQQVDATGHVIRTLDDEYQYDNEVGGHTLSVEGGLVFLAKVRNSEQSTASDGLRSQYGIHKMTADGSITTLLTLDLPDLTPRCIHSSHINGDLLIGLSKDSFPWTDGRVMRCNGTGRKIGDIELDEEGQRLYESPGYITENKMNGDIVVSDDKKNALVVVDKSGRHRFDYNGQPTENSFHPKGVSIDILGRILVSHVELKRSRLVFLISLLDQEGRFLTRLDKEQKEPFTCLCVDNQNNIYVGFAGTIKVFS